ncbi:MAG: HU family DNA-binding protein [Proteiniphilum sp.]|nr:HU family DNA-binding protein [Proteiniphilum sp.]
MERTERTGINEIASLLSAKNEQITKEDATLFLKKWIAVINDSLVAKKQVEVTGFGTFSFSQIRESETNEQIEAGNEEVSYFYKIGFTPDETLRNSVNIFFSNFEPSLLSEGVTFDALPEVIAGETGEEEYIFNHIQKMVSLPRQQITETEIPQAEITTEEVRTEESITEEIAEKESEDISEEMIPVKSEAGIEAPEPDSQSETVTSDIPDEAPKPESHSETVASDKPVEATEPEESIESVPHISNILSESLQHLSPEAQQVSHKPGHHERVRKRRKSTTIWIPILGGAAIILAGLFFFRETHGKSGSDSL